MFVIVCVLPYQLQLRSTGSIEYISKNKKGGRVRKNVHLPLPNNAEGVTGGGGGAWTIGGAAGSS